MSKWEVIDKELQAESLIDRMVGGADVYKFTIQHIDTGDTKEVTCTKAELNEKIERGELDD